MIFHGQVSYFVQGIGFEKIDTVLGTYICNLCNLMQRGVFFPSQVKQSPKYGPLNNDYIRQFFVNKANNETKGILLFVR